MVKNTTWLDRVVRTTAKIFWELGRRVVSPAPAGVSNGCDRDRQVAQQQCVWHKP